MKIAGLSTGRPWRTLAIAALLGVLAIPGLRAVTITGDLSRMLPDRPGPAQGLALWLQGFAAGESVYGLLEVDEPDPARLASMGENLVRAFEASDLVISAAIRPAEGLPTADPLLTLELLDADGLDEVAARTTPAALKARAEGLKSLLLSPMDQGTRALLLRDPLGLLEMLGARLSGGVQRFDSAGGGFLSPDGRALLMVIRPVPVEGNARDFSERLEDDLRRRAGTVLGAAGDARFGVTGGLLYARHIEDATRADGARLALVSIFAVLLLYVGFYRSFHSFGTMLLLLPYSAMITLGGPGLLLGELTPMAAGFAAILFGLGVDPAVHLTSRYREARNHRGAQAAAIDAVRSVGPAVVTAAVTTALALTGIAGVGSEALSQMGILAGIGVLVNATVMLVVLPALWMVLGDRIGPDPGVGSATARRAAGVIHRRSGMIIALFAVAAVTLLAFRGPLSFSVSMDGFRPSTLEPVRVDKAIESHFGEERGRMIVLLRGTDREEILVANDAWAEALQPLVESGTIRAVESLSVLEPAAKTASDRRSAARARIDFAQTADALEAALVEVGFRAAPFAGALDGLRTFASGAGAEARPAAPWRAWFAEKHVAQVGDEVRIVTHVHRLAEPDPKELYDALLAVAPEPTSGVTVHVTGLPLVEYQAGQYLAMGIGPTLAACTLLLFFVLLFHYRRLRVVAVAFVPLAGGLFLFIGVYAALGVPITLFAMAGIPLLVGVGIDDHLFMLDRYFERGGRPGRLDDTLAGSGRAVLVTTLTTLAAFGVLSLSTFDALASMGQAVSLALAIAFIASLVLLPALLARFLPGPDAPDRS